MPFVAQARTRVQCEVGHGKPSTEEKTTISQQSMPFVSSYEALAEQEAQVRIRAQREVGHGKPP